MTKPVMAESGGTEIYFVSHPVEAILNLPLLIVHAPRLVERRRVLEGTLAAVGLVAEWVTSPDPGPVSRFRYLPNPRLTTGEVGVYLKQRAALRRVAAIGRRAWVLEDDPIFPDDFTTRFDRVLSHAPGDADLLFLGASCGLEVAPLPGNPHFGEAASTRSMSGYVVAPEAARRLADALDRVPIRRPIDHTINALLPALGLRTYWSVPALIANGSEAGVFPRTVSRRS